MKEERKTLEQREQMTDLERLRHSASHVLATAILKIWPEAQFAAGPPVETGFYYDVDLPHRISPDDFEKIEAEMKSEIKANHPFERVEVSREPVARTLLAAEPKPVLLRMRSRERGLAPFSAALMVRDGGQDGGVARTLSGRGGSGWGGVARIGGVRIAVPGDVLRRGAPPTAG